MLNFYLFIKRLILSLLSIFKKRQDRLPETGLGVLHLGELHQCSADLDDLDLIRDQALKAARAAKVTVVEEVTHRFAPHGISCVLVLAESHLSLHTWPEHNYVAIDLFTCDQSIKGEAILQQLQIAFGAQELESQALPRGMGSTKLSPK